MSRLPRTVLFLGLPSFWAGRLLSALMDDWAASRFIVLVRSEDAERVERFLRELGPDKAGRCERYVGKTAALDLGLSGAETRRLLAEITHVVHAGMILRMGEHPERLWDDNVLGTRQLVEFAQECKNIQQFVHFSSVHVSGTRTGLVREAEFARRPSFKNALERSLYHGEKAVRAAMSRLPTTIIRLGNVMGDSRTGEMGGFQGPYLVVRHLLSRDRNIPLVLPGRGAGWAHLVPVDYVCDAARAILRHDHAIGQTYHLTDPNPKPVARVMRFVCAYLQRPAPWFGVPRPLLSVAAKVPWAKRYFAVPEDFYDYIDHKVRYSTSATADALEGTGIHCPDLESYLPLTLEYAVNKWQRIRDKIDEQRTVDPLEDTPQRQRGDPLEGGELLVD